MPRYLSALVSEGLGRHRRNPAAGVLIDTAFLLILTWCALELVGTLAGLATLGCAFVGVRLALWYASQREERNNDALDLACEALALMLTSPHSEAELERLHAAKEAYKQAWVKPRPDRS